MRKQNGRYRIASDPCVRDRPRVRRSPRPIRGGLVAFPLAATFLWLTSGAVVGQPTPADTPLAHEVDALFDQLFKDPTNVDLNFRYAEAAVKLGNYEGAISAFERLLLYNPNFPGVKLELAELYMRLGSYNAARAYLDQAESAPDATQETRARVRALRDDVARATSPSKFAVNSLFGLRHQSNDGAEPAGADIVAGGIPLTLSAISVNRPGWDAFLGGNLRHTYDLGGDITVESNALIYASKQFLFSSINSAAVEVNSGPRFDIRGGGASKLVSLRPYALAGNVALGNKEFLWNVGAGLAADGAITQRLNAAGFYEFRSEHFSNLPPVPTATDMDASVHSVGGNLSYQLLESGNFSLQVSYAANHARRSFNSSDAFVVRANYTQSFQWPAEFGTGPLTVTPALYRIYSWSAAADPAVDPTLIPITREWRFGVSAELGITNNLSATAYVIREVVGANLASDRSTDTQVVFGMRVSF